MDSTETCEDCPYYEGCSDCTLFGTSYCPEQNGRKKGIQLAK